MVIAKTMIISRIRLFDSLFILRGVFNLHLIGHCFDVKSVIYIQNQRILHQMGAKFKHKTNTIG
jgi:hypothetical protein